MSQSLKVKLATFFDNGDKLEYEALVQADSYDAAAETARAAFAKALDGSLPNIDKIKIETNAPKH